MASDVKAGDNASHAKIKNKPTGDTVMADSNDYEFYVGSESILEGAALEINGTARIDGTLIGKVKVKHLIVGKPAKCRDIKPIRREKLCVNSKEVKRKQCS